MFTLSANAAVFSNSSFESADSWVYSSNNARMSGYYSTGWHSEGSQCYVLQRGTGGTNSSYYAQITQANVNFTGVTSIIFDCQDTGIDVVKLQFFIDDQKIGEYTNNGHTDSSTSWGSTATVYNIEFAFTQAFTGQHNFIIRLQEIGNYSPADAKYYRVDNVRLTPEPTTIALLGLGCLSFIRRKK
ncbi:MAG: hypothetical protein A2Y12_05095 [Planctomycetes bacterium GWF2_42_9]|nr:MAG: hypothetical protein A2Y12_05095 [Planctomycetes bacterium GWF2_42_9]